MIELIIRIEEGKLIFDKLDQAASEYITRDTMMKDLDVFKHKVDKRIRWLRFFLIVSNTLLIVFSLMYFPTEEILLDL